MEMTIVFHPDTELLGTLATYLLIFQPFLEAPIGEQAFKIC